MHLTVNKRNNKLKMWLRWQKMTKTDHSSAGANNHSEASPAQMEMSEIVKKKKRKERQRYKEINKCVRRVTCGILCTATGVRATRLHVKSISPVVHKKDPLTLNSETLVRKQQNSQINPHSSFSPGLAVLQPCDRCPLTLMAFCSPLHNKICICSYCS